MTYQDYALRCTQQDKPQLIALGVALGVLQIDAETGAVNGTQGNAWDEIGSIYDAAGQPVLADDGKPYWHANLRTDVDLMTRAEAIGGSAVAAAMAQLGRWFVADVLGNPVQPAAPARVWL